MRLERTMLVQLTRDTNKQCDKNKFINKDLNFLPHFKLLKANSSYTKQYSNSYGPMEFSYGGQSPIPATKSSSAFNPILSDPF
jgi:hypothetical protein